LHSGHQVAPIPHGEQESFGKDLLDCNAEEGQPDVGIKQLMQAAGYMEQLVSIAEDKLLVQIRL
jgi:hypothetical protein